MHGSLTLFLVFLIGTTVTPVMAECRFASPDHRVALLELYTSEGCSSCPPADKWLSALPGEAISSEQFVPLAMHVDYWNYIGWQDPYSSPRYTQRQRLIASNNGLSTIYTPQLVLQGRDFRAWRRMNFPALLAELNKQPAQASIEVSLDPVSARVFNVQAGASSQQPGSRLFVALYENNLSSQVTAGENNGRLLRHDYVVRALYGPVSTSSAGKPGLMQQIQIPETWDLNNMGLAAFVENSNGEILQATSHAFACPG